MTLNLYMVMDSNYDWCCYVFETSRNRAKLRVADEFDFNYLDMRCKTLKKGVNFPYAKLVEDKESKGYDIVKQCGYEYDELEDYI